MVEPQSNPTPVPEAAPATSVVGNRLRNLVIALVAIALSVSLYLGLNTQSGTGLLATMADEAIPLEFATRNSKPSLVEFYADWCTSCQAMAPDLQELKQAYSDRINFVMLNVDNTKWLPEMVQYRVDGIPHFVFLDATGNPLGQAIGEQPRSIMEENLIALSAGSDLPHAKAIVGQTSAVSAPVAKTTQAKTAPRSHSSQAVD